MNRKNIPLLGSALAMSLLILDSRCAISAAEEGVQICIRTVIPSLFPFFILTIFLSGSISSGALLRPLGKAFLVSPGEEAILVSGLLGGYPVGAQATAEGYRSKRITDAQANRLLCFCSQAGPSFLFGMVAMRFPNWKYPWLLWLTQLLSAITVARTIPPTDKSFGHPAAQRSVNVSDAMKKALSAMASVCGWLVIFRVIIGFLQRWVLWLLPGEVRILVSGALELTNGCLLLDQIPSLSRRFLLAAVMLNSGGLCVLLQTVSVAKGLDIHCYIKGKLLQVLYSLCYAAAFLGHLWALIPVFMMTSLPLIQNKRKNSSIPRRVGV